MSSAIISLGGLRYVQRGFNISTRVMKTFKMMYNSPICSIRIPDSGQ